MRELLTVLVKPCFGVVSRMPISAAAAASICQRPNQKSSSRRSRVAKSLQSIAMRRAVVQRLARFSIRPSPSSSHAFASTFATTEKERIEQGNIHQVTNSGSPVWDPVNVALSREDRTTFDARRNCSADSKARAYATRNYADNIYEYNKVLDGLNQSRRLYLIRDVYEDMLLDGVRPIRTTFHTLINGCMKGQRLQDAMYFFDEMKAMGLQPDVVVYNCIISTCGQANQMERAFRVAAEMEANGMKPTHRTFLALLSACGTAGNVEIAYGVVQRMAAFGLTLNSACYAALIESHKNSRPVNHVTFQKIFELLEQSKGCDTSTGEAEGKQEFEEELANLVTGGGLQPTRSYVNRRLNVYYSAIRACGNLGNIEAVEKIIEMFLRDNHQLDAICVTELVKAYVGCRQFEKALEVVDEYTKAGKNPSLSLFMTLIESLLQWRTPANMAAAKKLLDQMSDRGFFLNTSFGSTFLFLASLDKEGDYATANCIWDMMHKRNLRPSIKSLSAYRNGLQERNVPDDDVRLAALTEIIAKVQKKNNWGRPAQTKTMKEGNLEQEDGDGMHVAADGDESTIEDFVAENHDAEEDQSSEHVAEYQISEDVAAVGESRTSL